jgi:AcrR family transcriptional regulator
MQSQSPRQRLLETASELFYMQGIRATGIDMIIAKANVAKASFYQHFPSKDALVVAFLERRDEAWREWLADAVTRLSPAPSGRPLAVFDALHERFGRKDFRGCAFVNSMIELADRSHAAHIAAATHKQKVISYLTALLKEASFESLPPSGIEALAKQLMLLIDGAIVTAVREGNAHSAIEAKQLAILLLDKGAASPPPRQSRRKANAGQ